MKFFLSEATSALQLQQGECQNGDVLVMYSVLAFDEAPTSLKH